MAEVDILKAKLAAAEYERDVYREQVQHQEVVEEWRRQHGGNPVVLTTALLLAAWLFIALILAGVVVWVRA